MMISPEWVVCSEDVSLCCRDGQKMSKRKKNYPDPMDIVSKYGADAIRWELE